MTALLTNVKGKKKQQFDRKVILKGPLCFGNKKKKSRNNIFFLRAGI